MAKKSGDLRKYFEGYSTNKLCNSLPIILSLLHKRGEYKKIRDLQKDIINLLSEKSKSLDRIYLEEVFLKSIKVSPSTKMDRLEYKRLHDARKPSTKKDGKKNRYYGSVMPIYSDDDIVIKAGRKLKSKESNVDFSPQYYRDLFINICARHLIEKIMTRKDLQNFLSDHCPALKGKSKVIDDYMIDIINTQDSLIYDEL